MRYSKLMKDFIIKMLSSDSAISSKRVSGFVGWLTCIGMALYSTISGEPTTNSFDILLVTSASLIGLDSFVNTIKTIYKK